MNSFFIPFLSSFLISIIVAPFYIKFAKRLNFGQNILSYVKEHNSKQGTPTMGGVIFILPTILVALLCTKGNLTLTLLILAVFLSYGIVGFLDDFIKIKFKRNLGLRAYQKIIFQFLIALIVAIFVYNSNVFSKIYVPFSSTQIDLKMLAIPFVIILFVATTNSVNLTDGLDGLASGTSIVFFAIFTIINSFYLKNFVDESQIEYITQMQNLNIISYALLGALGGFFMFNFYPAKIFMGDTGSLALGALIACVSLFSGLSFYLPILGVMFVVSSVSVIIQVLHFKRTKRRVFLMAPFHHHLQHKGMYETKITLIYITITLVAGLITLAILGGV